MHFIISYSINKIALFNEPLWNFKEQSIAHTQSFICKCNRILDILKNDARKMSVYSRNCLGPILEETVATCNIQSEETVVKYPEYENVFIILLNLATHAPTIVKSLKINILV